MSSDKGSILILGLLMISVLLLLSGVFLSLSLINYGTIVVDSNLLKSEWIAYAGVHQVIYDIEKNFFEKDNFINLQQKWLKGIQFAEGMYRIGIIPVSGLGVREIAIVSLGTNKAGDSSAIINRLQIYTPTDYLYFFDGNGSVAIYGAISVLGSVHANGSLFLDGGPAQGYLRIVKSDDEDVIGPTVSATGIVFRGRVNDVWEGADPIYTNPEVKIIIGIGNIQEMFSETNPPYYKGLTHGTERNNLETKDFYITRFAWNPYQGSIPTYAIPSYNSSPDITFPITRSDSNIEHLLIDGKHGAYKINITKKEKIFSYFEPYIDKNWKINYNNLRGGKVINFYNDVIKTKQPLVKSGDEYIFSNSGSEIVASINYGLGGWFVDAPLNSYYAFYNPFLDRGLYSFKVNNVSKIFGIDYTYFTSRSDSQPKIIFTSGVSAGQTITANKLKYLYAANKSENYKASTYGSEPGIQISPLTVENFLDDGSSGRIKLRSSITNLRTIYYVTGSYYYGNQPQMDFLTSSLINTNTAVWTTISSYSYSYVGGTGNYGTDSRLFRLFPLQSFNTGFDETLTLNDITGTPNDSVQKLSYDLKRAFVNYYNNSVPVTVINRPVIKYNEDSTTWYGWIGLPFVDTSLSYNLTIWKKSTNTAFRDLVPSEYTLGTGSHIITVTGAGKTDLADTDYALLITYQSKYREIIDVTATINTPEQAGFDSFCIDQLVNAVSLDLSTITESNYPKDGVIFSEVPLIVFGIPQKKITIVSLEDIYVANINSSYRDINGNWISSSLTIDDPSAKPVAIISGKAIFVYHEPNNIRPINPGLPDYNITLNKVILFTQSNKIVSYGGWYEKNEFKVIGSMIFGNALAITNEDIYHTYNYVDVMEHLEQNYRINTMKKAMYSKSFREEIPSRIPMTINKLQFRKVSSEKAENSINTLQVYFEKGSEQKDIYKEIIKNLND